MLNPALSIEQFDKPPIPLINPDTGEKVKLRLRRMSFAREISALPSDILEIHKILVEGRRSKNESIYVIVSAWNKLSIYEEYWKSFNFTSEIEYLTYYGLPDGSTLAGWTVMVNLFDKSTFVLLGEQVIAFMMRLVGHFEKNPDKRKQAYQSIFDNYCSLYDNFDKNSFFEILRKFIRKNYEEPLAEQAGSTIEEYRLSQRISKKRAPRKYRKRVLVDTDKQEIMPMIPKDFQWEDGSCSHCIPKILIIGICKKYIEELERIVNESNPSLLPKRPEEIREL